ncbi:HAD family hydrolase [Streptomyces sp. NPDC001851]|uniref:HAD family hydrolase n=1 Tax=Streptomyces sp. NPDC001851 TaxID=3154529 RepID=UPI00331B69FE
MVGPADWLRADWTTTGREGRPVLSVVILVAGVEQLHRQAVDAELAPVDGLPEALDALALPTDLRGLQRLLRQGAAHPWPRWTLRALRRSHLQLHRGLPRQARPDLFLHAARQTGVDPEACVVVKDSQPGVRAARAARRSPVAREARRLALPLEDRPGY